LVLKTTVNIPSKLLEEFDEAWKAGGYADRTEAIRQAMMDLIQTIRRRK